MKKTKIICYVAGKSGGHIIPCLTLAQDETRKHPQTQILFFTTQEPLDIEITSSSPQISWHVPLPLNAAFGGWNIFLYLYNLMVTLAKTLFYLIKHRPAEVICTGGFLAIPVAFCARILAIPVITYELNAQPGKATRLLAYWSSKICICFAETQKYFSKKKCHKVAYPIRFFGNTKQVCQKAALKELGLTMHRKTVLILGGSQGSLQINNLMRDWVVHCHWMHDNIQIIHQTGRVDAFDWHSFYQEHRIPAVVLSFGLDLALYYSAADLIICRSGAGSLFETLFFGKPCITIPLETATNKHQVANAQAMAKEYDDLFTVIRHKQLAHAKEPLFAKIETMLGFHHIKEEPFLRPEL